DLEHLAGRTAFEHRLGHAGDDVRLRNGLSMADWQRGVLVCARSQSFIYEQAARDVPDLVEYRGIGDALIAQSLDQALTRSGRRHAYAGAISAHHRRHGPRP